MKFVVGSLTENIHTMTIQAVGQFKLNQQGDYICRTEFVYLDDNNQLRLSSISDNELLGQTYTTNPGDFGVPDGTVCWMKIWVMWGVDNMATQPFIYQKDAPFTAEYTCTGTSVRNHLWLQGVLQTA